MTPAAATEAGNSLSSERFQRAPGVQNDRLLKPVAPANYKLVGNSNHYMHQSNLINKYLKLSSAVLSKR